MSKLPDCQWRVATEDRDVYFCRHSRVRSRNNLVEPLICQICDERCAPCENPRPMPTLEQIKNPPPLPSMLWNLTKSITSFVADGMRTVDKLEYERRLSVCQSCDRRTENRCHECGCFLTIKAAGRAFDCPIGKWRQDDA